MDLEEVVVAIVDLHEEDFGEYLDRYTSLFGEYVGETEPYPRYQELLLALQAVSDKSEYLERALAHTD